ncbi:hypothetical protein FRACYDRAFT_250011 [Fragilariopsis cylindrus CCMP1102]|uniref:Uncharacterized protein n=1 Tax=Fragilariopsis cylindrus CCMP1102 TaxID=635003 RepID=A0A1E7EQX2_9STRA|nr:hypothetical protein FRACYDRAFT_250011 [Fragilariopsis cylindrus CCMP1102]|eukprot:OEU08224.1 hypothetical protein FRACYDRAFT_250011 [Fragilariopsis cylindrus CCMP1102]
MKIKRIPKSFDKENGSRIRAVEQQCNEDDDDDDDDINASNNDESSNSTPTTMMIQIIHHPDKERLKRHRRDQTATNIVGGAVLGTIICPIVGTILLGSIVGYTTNVILKKKESTLQRNYEQQQYHSYALYDSPVVKYNAVVV